MRTKAVYCDWCGAQITETLIVYSSKYLQPHGTYEGARDTWDFCSDEHLTAWKDEHAMRRMKEKRTHRVGPGTAPGAEEAAEYRAVLEAQIDARIAEALTGKWSARDPQ